MQFGEEGNQSNVGQLYFNCYLSSTLIWLIIYDLGRSIIRKVDFTFITAEKFS